MLIYCHFLVHRCFVESSHFYGAVLAPSVSLVIAHFVLFIPILKNMKQSDNLLPNSLENRREKNSDRAKATFIVDLLMTSLWSIALIHAYLRLELLRLVYCAFIPVLGLSVCIAHIVQSKDAREAWGKVFFCCMRKSKPSDVPELVKMRQKQNLISAEESEAKRGICFVFYCFGYLRYYLRYLRVDFKFSDTRFQKHG